MESLTGGKREEIIPTEFLGVTLFSPHAYMAIF
jgi:hypothetical protein